MNLAKQVNFTQKYEEEIIATCKKAKTQPKLIIIRTGHDPASETYVNIKLKTAKKLGIDAECIHITDLFVVERQLMNLINQFNDDPSVHGIIVQSPIAGLDTMTESEIFSLIDPAKDVDALGIVAQAYDRYPCTPQAVVKSLQLCDVPIKDANVLVIGRSEIVGAPLAKQLTGLNANVMVAHSRTSKESMRQLVSISDIIISATGQVDVIDESWVTSHHVLIDVGVIRENGPLRGDLNQAHYDRAKAYIPSPGGIGPLTVRELLLRVAQNAQYAC